MKLGEDHRSVPCRMFRDGVWRDFHDVVSLEQRVCIEGPDGRKADLWAYPVGLEQLVLGHAYVEWGSAGGHPSIVSSGESVHNGRTSRNYTIAFEPRALSVSVTDNLLMDGPGVLQAASDFIREQGLWDGTGCFHRASVYHPASGRFLKRAEDIARHNCLDRLAGWALCEDKNPANLVLFVSARVTASLCSKALKCGFRFIVSRSAITSTALDLAIANDLTLLGFCREHEKRFTVFHNAGRVAYDEF
ncbi:MAG: formate dehydrogenase accessory sulfurtransferase FdhD [Desulfovibrio sp.]|uniref:formate dehydrogenase accessory sulfurtransferase FdhD n=1 Tax=Desulfovibrio sp. 7SRBS1 TaxID=3378064 RepID=UPI003B4174C2